MNSHETMTMISPLKTIYRISGLRWLRWWVVLRWRAIVVPRWRAWKELQHARELARLRSGYVFPSGMLNINDPGIFDNWGELSKGYEDENLVKGWLKNVRSYSMVTYDGLLVLSRLVRYCEENQMVGRFVETGTWRGGAFTIMAKSSQTWGDGQRQIWGFDSFEGIPEPDSNVDDVQWSVKEMKVPKDQQKGRLQSVNALVAAEDEVYKALKTVGADTTNIKLFKGWFQDTLPRISDDEIGPIALLRLDGDLYASTMICLEKFEPHVVSGGFIIIDDWGLKGCQQAVVEFYQKKYGRLPMLHFIDDVARYIQKH